MDQLKNGVMPNGNGPKQISAFRRILPQVKYFWNKLKRIFNKWFIIEFKSIFCQKKNCCRILILTKLNSWLKTIWHEWNLFEWKSSSKKLIVLFQFIATTVKNLILCELGLCVILPTIVGNDSKVIYKVINFL